MHFSLFSKYCYTKDVLSLPFKQEKSKKCIRRWRTMVFSLQGNGYDVHRILSQAPSRMIKRKENDFAFECWCHDSTIAASVTIPSGCLAWHHIIVMIIIMTMWITTTGVGSELKKKIEPFNVPSWHGSGWFIQQSHGEKKIVWKWSTQSM